MSERRTPSPAALDAPRANHPEAQLPLELGHRPALTRDDLVVTPANRAAAGLVDRWPDWPATVVVLAGPAGSGKTHLGRIWAAAAGAGIAAARQPLAPRPDGAPGGPALFVDECEAGRIDEAALFHAINEAKSAGANLMLASRSFPSAWDVRLPDLASRLKAATVVEIDEPDDLLLAGVMTKLFADRQVEVDGAVIQYLVRRIERSLATAIQVVDRLDSVALARQTRITRPLAAEIVEAIDEGQQDFGL